MGWLEISQHNQCCSRIREEAHREPGITEFNLNVVTEQENYGGVESPSRLLQKNEIISVISGLE